MAKANKPAAAKVPCDDCSFQAKNNSGLAAHRRARHPEPQSGPVEVGVRRDLRDVDGLAGLQASAITLAAKLDETTSARDLPALAAELRQTLSDLGVSVNEEVGADDVDQLAARRKARFADSTHPVVTPKSK